MATVTIRDLDDKLVKALKAIAKRNQRSLEAELRVQLAKFYEDVRAERRFIARAKRIAAMTPKAQRTNSTALIRKDRDR